MARPRFGFLSVFFAALTIVLAVAVFLRIRSYDTTSDATASATVPELPIDAAPPGTQPPAGERTMTLVELPNATAPPTLRSAAPPEFAPLEPEKPSLLSRLLESLTGGQTPPPATKASPDGPVQRTARQSQPQQRQSQPQQQQPRNDNPRNSRDTTGGTGDPPKVNDITSDSTPPRLAAIEFTPPQIRDGEETMLAVQATDDLSGIRSISGTIVAPSGAVQGFACQREGETNRFFSRVVVPKDAAEGVWSVNYLNLMDNASNSATVTAAQAALPPTASFRVVSSRPDSQGPTLKAIWIDKRAMRGGEKNLVFVQAEDDKSGLNLISGIFQSPSRAARVGFVCRASAETSWQCEFNAPNCADCGEWQLEQLQLQDKANNMTTLRAQANEMVNTIRVDISSDLCDATPPTVQAITLDQTVVSNVDPSTIAVTATLGDDQCGVLSVSGQAVGPNTSGQPPRLYFSFSPAGDQHTWVGRVVVPRLAAKGIWRISFLQVLDRGQNLKTYSQNDPVLANAAFTVR